MLLTIAMGMAVADRARAAPPAILYDGPDGVTCTHFNKGSGLAWRNNAGDWRDTAGKPQGIAALARAALAPKDSAKLVEWDVTGALNAIRKAGARELGLVVTALPGQGNGTAHFYSREDPDVVRRPTLRIDFANDKKDYLAPSADTHTDCSTNASLGRQPKLVVGSGRAIFVAFDLAEIRETAAIRRATLQLVRTPERHGELALGVFFLDSPQASTPVKPQPGLAGAYPGDKGIERDPGVYMATDFESARWLTSWSSHNTYGAAPSFETVDRDELANFKPLLGRALRVRIPKGRNLGLDLRYEFNKKTGAEPEEVYFRYYLRLAEDWRPTVDGGKMPGFGGTYGLGGWGDRPADGLKGWAMRGSFNVLPSKENPLHDYITLGTYASHADPSGRLGEVWPWSDGLNGLVQRNRWYCIEQYIKLNTPAAKNGIMRVWVDGQLAFEKTDIRMRDIVSLKIEYVWMNVYHGGTATAPRDMHLFIDNVVIARRYVGPMTGP